ncbi:MAG: DUF115 domain-containing protein [Spirochaetales bacterium]|nr:DUF115 domain-containing protein [Spirochaetales bacterium]
MATEGHPPLLKDTGNGVTVFYRGKYLYSSKNPAAAARTLASKTAIPPASLVFVPSFGLGYGVGELLKRLPENCHVLCVERDPELMRFAETEALGRFRGEDRLTVVQADTLLPVREILARLSPGSFRRVVRLTLCGAARLSPEFYDAVESYLAREIQIFWQNKMTVIHLGLLYVKNLFANLPLLPRARDMGGLTVRRPLVVVGAGPSLSRSLPLVRALAGRCALLAVDTALPVLLASGLVPDFILSLEPQFVNLGDFLALGGRSIPLIADLASSPQVVRFCLEKRDCPVYFFSSAFHPLALWERLKDSRLLPRPIPPLGSVGVAAVYAALRLTRAPVFLAGLDFSFPFSRTHASGSPGDLRGLAASDRLRALGGDEFSFFCGRSFVALAAKDGGRVASDLVLSSYAQNLAALVAGERRVFDLNPFGLPLGAPIVAGPDEAGAVLSASAGVELTAPGEPDLRPEAWNRTAVRSFLEAEETLVQQEIEVFADLVESGRPSEGVLNGRRWEIVRRADHVWFQLPERIGLPRYTKAYAAQALAAGRYMLHRIARARAAID